MQCFITYRDELGYITVEVDTTLGIQFLEGKALFTALTRFNRLTIPEEVKIPVADISEIYYE